MEKKLRQKARKKSTLVVDEIVEADTKNDFVAAVPVSNSFDPLGKTSIAEIEAKEETANLEAGYDLSSKDLSENKPPDIQIAAPHSESKDSVMEMNAAEFSKLLDDCITNFRSKQGSK